MRDLQSQQSDSRCGNCGSLMGDRAHNCMRVIRWDAHEDAKAENERLRKLVCLIYRKLQSGRVSSAERLAMAEVESVAMGRERAS